ncbi:MAG: phosphoribosylformylglycinamidine synthase subunit PurL, partial [Coriobacteriales bacterium]|nr:phosphoribosylformylglycinamidine synthase subunit PurL [Coriobacteriales bacterium]
YFDAAYDGNCLVNAMAIGLMREEQLTRAIGSGPGNLVVLLGSTTGRDGIGGASVLASQGFTEAAETKRPAVQVGDPCMEKLLIEACLELLDRGLLVALSDLGAAGLTCAASEMASRGGVGIDIDVAKVPRREAEMMPYEVMVAESQERMLAVVRPEDWLAVADVAGHWEVPASVIGTITDTGRFVVRDSEVTSGSVAGGVKTALDQEYLGDPVGLIVADIPAEMLADAAPLYNPLALRPAYLDEVSLFDMSTIKHPDSPATVTQVFMDLLASPNIASRAWIYRQFDHQVMNNTVVLPGADAAVIRIGDTGRGLTNRRGIAATTDCNGRYCYLDPYRGAQIAVAEAARNLACVGAEPAAITDCLNFGNPQNPEVYYAFTAAIDGLSDACRAFGIPVVSGNVSFYNESFGNAIYPTPAIGMVGIVEDISQVCTTGFQTEGDVIVLIGETADELGGSEYLSAIHGLIAGIVPELDLELETDVQQAICMAIRKGLVQSAHDLSEGGLAIALAESCIAGNLGASITLDDDLPAVACLFSETQSRILVSVAEIDMPDFIKHLLEWQVPYSVLGEVNGFELVVNYSDEAFLSLPLSEIKALYENALQDKLES